MTGGYKNVFLERNNFTNIYRGSNIVSIFRGSYSIRTVGHKIILFVHILQFSTRNLTTYLIHDHKVYTKIWPVNHGEYIGVTVNSLHDAKSGHL